MMFDSGVAPDAQLDSAMDARPDTTSDARPDVGEPRYPIATRPLPPQTHRISIDALPAPFATSSTSNPPDVVAIPAQPTLAVPAGFQVNVFAENLEAPRWLALTPAGEVLVTETRANRIRLLHDRDGNGEADDVSIFVDDDLGNEVDIPFGMAFAPGAFFLGNQDEVRRYDYAQGQAGLTGRGTQITALPGGGYNQHWTRNVMLAPDGQHLYVTIGSGTNVDVEAEPRATIQIMNLDGSNRRTFATGLRNPVGVAFHPVTGALYTTVNERDGLGDNLVPDYFTRVTDGGFYGWPYSYLRPNLLDPRRAPGGTSERPDLVARTITPDVLLQAHSAPLGVIFYTGTTFPARYRNGAFVAFRGSWNRANSTGYGLVFIPFDEQNRPTGEYEDFLTGFQIESSSRVWGRPVGLLQMPDGSILFTEEPNGRVYRVQYRG